MLFLVTWEMLLSTYIMIYHTSDTGNWKKHKVMCEEVIVSLHFVL